MEETAWFTHLTAKTRNPLSGAMRPATALSADGPLNLLNAVRIAADRKQPAAAFSWHSTT
ncbi:MAG: asparaginase domain-containing protein [Sutterella wadsworthensis]